MLLTGPLRRGVVEARKRRSYGVNNISTSTDVRLLHGGRFHLLASAGVIITTTRVIHI